MHQGEERAGNSRRPEAAGELLNVTQVAQLLGCSTAHVYDLCERGELPSLRDANNTVTVAAADLVGSARLIATTW